MAIPSKEENILKLILENSPLKEWHFKEILQRAGVTRAVANKWLKKYVQEGLLKKIKENGQFPYYIVGSQNPCYHSKKRLYALQQLYQSGLIQQLTTLKNAKTVILFGSFTRGDWYQNSDIDLFILGNADDFDKNPYEVKLQKSIELHLFENKAEIQAVQSGLMNNIREGYLVKGHLQDLAEA